MVLDWTRDRLARISGSRELTNMARKRIFTVGFELPGEEFEYVPFDSDQSLLDADIILYEAGFGEHFATENYEGEPLFDHYASVSVARNLQHWRSELTTATNFGKLVIVYLTKPQSYWRYTGERQFSGTGRSRVTTNIVAPITSYSSIPGIDLAEAKTGKEVRLAKDAGYLGPYWKEFGASYQAFISGKFTQILLTTKGGERTVGAALLGKGSLLFLPPLTYNRKAFTKYNARKQQTFWTTEAMEFGNRLVGCLAALAEQLLSRRSVTPPPPWAMQPRFMTPEEGAIQGRVADLSRQMVELQRRQALLEQDLQEAGSIRSLLFEQGKPLEKAVRKALTILGFSAEPFSDGESEFDVVFVSPEGRCLGEVEGKDNKPVNIEKFSQLERNLQEDFARDGVNEYAKGVLFGNPERLKAPEERGDAFTQKCLTAARRVGVALVRTADLFDPVRYLRTCSDPDYAQICRNRILQTSGEVVSFPPPPEASTNETRAQDPSANRGQSIMSARTPA